MTAQILKHISKFLFGLWRQDPEVCSVRSCHAGTPQMGMSMSRCAMNPPSLHVLGENCQLMKALPLFTMGGGEKA